MEVLYQATYYNENTVLLAFFFVIATILLILSKKIISFFYNMNIQTKARINKAEKSEPTVTKENCVLLVRALLIVILAVILFSYVTELIPVAQYTWTGKCSRTEGVVENYECTVYNGVITKEAFTVGDCYFDIQPDDVQLTYTGGLLHEGMHVIIEYYSDGDVNKILKILSS